MAVEHLIRRDLNMIKEQRVFKNNGKFFEQDFADSFGDHVWTYRPKDSGGGQMARFTHESLCDLMAYNTKTKNLTLYELKSTLGTSVSIRPYSEGQHYEKVKAEYELWNSMQTAQSRKPIKEEIKKRKKMIKDLYKELNKSMIKYHQVLGLLETTEKHGIQTFIAFTFFKTTQSYAVPIQEFVKHWKQMDKKSINEDDLDLLVSENRAYRLDQAYIRKTMRSTYDFVDQLSEIEV